MKRFNKFLSLIMSIMVFAICICNVGYADTSNSASEKARKVGEWCSALEELFDKCDNLGITSVYDSADYEIVKLFSERMANETDSAKTEHYFDVIAHIYNNVRNNLIAYINGSDVPLDVEKRVMQT